MAGKGAALRMEMLKGAAAFGPPACAGGPRIESIDHFVIAVADLEAILNF